MSTGAAIQSINPATEEVLRSFAVTTDAAVEAAVATAHAAFATWRRTAVAERARRLQAAAAYLRAHQARLATLATLEVGKPIVEAEAEVEKCAWVCDWFAEHAERLLRPEPHPSSATDSYVQFPPLGVVLAIMPWNFPFWQWFRFAAPALMAGNTAVLKHAPNVPQCALAIEDVFRAAGFPDGVVRTLLIAEDTAERLVADPRIVAVTLTGSDRAGSAVAAAAGRALKKSVLELGGTDAFVVLADADLEAAIATGVRARFQNTGQSCIAAKRFILESGVYDTFLERFVAATKGLRVGDPLDRATQVGPLARGDLRERLVGQVAASVAAGARVCVGGRAHAGRGYFFEPTVLADVTPDMLAVREEVFGPVAAVLRVRDAAEAVAVANQSAYGLGASLWTRDVDTARRLAGEFESGQVFVNGMVASDPRLPFGGVKRSGWGRELAGYGIREFVNIQTVWIGPRR